MVADQFVRTNYSVTTLLRAPGTNNTLTVAFNATTAGRWMACSGGWDWGPYSNTFEGTDHSFSKGIWQPVSESAVRRCHHTRTAAPP